MAKTNRRSKLQKDQRTFNSDKRQMNRRNSTKNQRRDKEVVDSVLRSESNPYSWYDKNAQFTKDAGGVGFAKPLGALLSGGPSDKFVNPGVMRLTFSPIFGFSQDLQSPVNRAAGELFTYIRSVMRVSGNYDAADLMIYLLGLDSCYMFHAMMRRAYDTAQLYTPMNKYYPRTLLQYQGFDPTIANDLSAFRSYINKFAYALGRYAVPAGFDVTDRHQWMCSGLYLDSETTRAQSYLFCPQFLWTFNNTGEQGSSLVPSPWQLAGTTISLHNLEEVISFGEALLDAITNDEDVLEMSGDIYRAYGPENLRKLSEVTDQERLMPVYDKTVLSQIENASVVGDALISQCSVTQDPSVNSGAIITHYAFDGKITWGVTPTQYLAPAYQIPAKFINLHNDNPSPEEIIEATRLSAANSVGILSSPVTELTLDTMPADVINRIWIGMFNPNGTGALSTLSQPTNCIIYAKTATAPDLLNRMQFMSMLNSFDWAPMMYLYDISNVTGPNQEANLVHVIADVDNFDVISTSRLDDMHTAAMYSLFDVPKVARL